MTDEVVRALRICAGGHCTEQDKENTCPWSCGDETCLTEQQNDAATLIETLLAENAKLKEAQRWVPVSESFPEEPGYYEVLSADTGGPEKRFFYAWEDNGEWADITHWRKLPQPPKGE